MYDDHATVELAPTLSCDVRLLRLAWRRAASADPIDPFLPSCRFLETQRCVFFEMFAGPS
jgi:hypothetical protein